VLYPIVIDLSLVYRHCYWPAYTV